MMKKMDKRLCDKNYRLNWKRERSHEAYLKEARAFFEKINHEYEDLTITIPSDLIGTILSLEHHNVKRIPLDHIIKITRRTAREIIYLAGLKERYVNHEDRKDRNKIEELKGVMKEAINDPPPSPVMQMTGGDRFYK